MTRELSRRSIWLLACLFVTGKFAFTQQTGPEYGWSTLVPPPPSTTRAWERSPIESFTWPTSVKPGETITFYTSVIDTANHPSYRIQIFRMGDSSPRIDLGSFQSHFYPLRAQNGTYIYPNDVNPPKPIDFKRGCSQWWASSAQAYSIPTTGWPSGLYYANMIFNPATTDTGTAYFVVRAANPGTSSKILYKFPVNTYQAYNWWGGGSLYSCTQDAASLTVTDSIAMDRPLKFEFANTLKLYSVDRYFIRWAETNGYTMEYGDNIDVDKNESNFISNYKFIVHVGHDEYWSGASELTAGERANEENFKNGGGNLAFFAANTCYWRIYWVPNAGGVIDYKRLKCKKDKCDGADSPPPDLWRAGNNSNPEAFFIGSQYEKGYNDGQDIPAQVYNKDHWIFKGTNLQNGQFFGLGNDPSHTKGILGPEIDNTNYAEKPQFAFLNTLEILAERPVPTVVQEVPVKVTANITHQATYYEDTQSNARVFNAATIQWARGLAEYYDTNDWNRMKQINSNIMDHFSFKKYLGNIYANLLIWGDEALETSTKLDGDTFIQPGKTLTLTGNFTLTIDPGVTLYVDGTLVIGKNVTITGGGQIVTRGSGKILVTNSATALASNNSRKLARDVIGNYHLVFETEGEICYEKLTNGGTAISEFRRLSNGVADGVKSNPCIYARDGNILVVWQKYTGSTHDITFHKSTDYGATWPTSNRIVIASAVGANPPLPVIVSPRINELFVVYRTATNLSYQTSSNYGNTWSVVTAVPSSGTSGNSPTLAVTNTYYGGNVRTALVNAATGGNGAIFYRYYKSGPDSTGWASSLLKNLSIIVPGLTPDTRIPRWRRVVVQVPLTSTPRGKLIPDPMASSSIARRTVGLIGPTSIP